MPHTHRDVPPVEDMLHWSVATDSIADEFRKGRLAVGDDRQQTAWLPSSGRELIAHPIAWRRCCVDDHAKSPNHMPVFELADDKIQASPLILRPTANVGAVRKNRQTAFWRLIYPDATITLTGHSLGGGLAGLIAPLIRRFGPARNTPDPPSFILISRG